MEYSVEKQSGSKVKISFQTPASDFEAALEKAYLKNRGRINVPGFRKGKAPRKLIERMYGEAIFYDDALEMIFPDAYTQAVQKEDLHPVSQPQLSVEKIEKGKDVAYSCEVYVQPEVKLGAYRAVEIARTQREVSQAEVDERLAQEQKRVARSVEITDRAVESGDEVNLDYSGTVDGVLFDGGTASGQKLLIGSNSFIPGFEEQMIGLKIGEEKDLNVRFPDEYHAENLKGKDAVFHVKVNAIAHEELPELDDDFASEVSDFNTLTEYSADIRAKLQATADEQATETAKQSLVQKIVDAAEIELPAPMVEDKLDEMLSEMNWRMQQQGFDMKKYMQITGQTEEQMRDMYRGEATNSLKTELVIEQILQQENIQADDKDVDALLEDYAKSVGKTLEKLKSDFNESQLAYFNHRARVNKALDLLWNSALVTDQKPESDADSADDAKKATTKRSGTRKGTEKSSAEETEADKTTASKTPAKPKAKTAAKKDGAEPAKAAE